jgi:exopolyphosphatase/guanosine-5'-triphosphate,3'-diphosphate pyrophosphatase
MKRFAVIDLGTNTFHVLIAGRKSEKEFIEIYRERIYVKIGQEGIDLFSPSALKRAYEAMRKIRQIVDLFEAIEIRAFATAAFRTAKNSDVLIRRIDREFNIQVEIISGNEEARLIYEGVKSSGAIQRGQNLIMDIGGGSVEFILGTKEELTWSVSLELGASILKNKFHTTDPMSQLDQCELRLFLKKSLAPLAEVLKEHPLTTLIGSSGTFDVLADALPVVEKIGLCRIIHVQDFTSLRIEIQHLSLLERIAHPSIPESRADLIVVAFILLDEVVQLNPAFKYMIVSPYALKEGMVVEMIEGFVV